jgi:hypothetical protein
MAHQDVQARPYQQILHALFRMFGGQTLHFKAGSASAIGPQGCQRRSQGTGGEAVSGAYWTSD